MVPVECLASNQVRIEIRTHKIDFLKIIQFERTFSDRECLELPQPELGSVNMTGREFGGKAIYTCPIGYNVIGVLFFVYKLLEITN